MKLNHLTVVVDDFDATVASLGALPGLKPGAVQDGYAEIETAGVVLALFARPALAQALGVTLPAGPLTILQFETEDVEGASRIAQESGAKLVREAFTTPWGSHSSYLLSIDGQLLEFYRWA